MSRKIIVYIASSIDGYIARPDGNIDWLSIVNEEGQDYGYQAFMQRVDTVIMGKNTYDTVLKMGVEVPHQGKIHYIFTRQKLQSTIPNVIYKANLIETVKELLQESGKHIYCDGGATIISQLLEANLIDELIISILPIMLGQGIRLFDTVSHDTHFTLINCTQFNSGLVQLHYQKKDNIIINE